MRVEINSVGSIVQRSTYAHRNGLLQVQYTRSGLDRYLDGPFDRYVYCPSRYYQGKGESTDYNKVDIVCCECTYIYYIYTYMVE